MSLLASRKAIGCKWAFKVKDDPHRTVHKYKAHFVTKGFHQMVGFDFNETFSLLEKPSRFKSCTHNGSHERIRDHTAGCE